MGLHDGLAPTEAAQDPEEQARSAWDDYDRWGQCEVCGKRGPVTRHHVIYRQHVQRWGGDEWDPANSMLVGDRFGRCTCHAMHHAAARRIPLSKVPASAFAFAVDLMGEYAAADYFRRYYHNDSREDPGATT